MNEPRKVYDPEIVDVPEPRGHRHSAEDSGSFGAGSQPRPFVRTKVYQFGASGTRTPLLLRIVQAILGILVLGLVVFFGTTFLLFFLLVLVVGRLLGRR